MCGFLDQGGAQGFDLGAGGLGDALAFLVAGVEVHDFLLDGQGRHGDLDTAHFGPVEGFAGAAPGIEACEPIERITIQQGE